MSANLQEIEDVITTLDEMFPNPGALDLGDPYVDLVAVILSARTRDEQVLKALPDFLDAYPTVSDLAQAKRSEIEKRINSIGMYRQKAKHLKSMAQDVVKKHDGKIPDTMEALTDLAGVGRKTASVVLVSAFDKPAIAVDTHVHRVTNRLGWVDTKRPKQTERKLLEIIPERLHAVVNRVFVKFGRYICLSQYPRCGMCPLQKYCVYPDKQLDNPDDPDAVRKDIEEREDNLEKLRAAVK